VVDGRANPEQECSVKEIRALLAKALDRLAPMYKQVVHMFHMQELPAKEAARILGVPVGTVKARLHRARRKLTRYVQLMLVRQSRSTIVKLERTQSSDRVTHLAHKGILAEVSRT
jgi:DNA-directed RNA polymerase specialized sigma24 family protein